MTSRGTRRAAACVLLISSASAAGCAEPLEFADWTIPVPEGTRIIEYAAVRPGERSDLLGIERDLVISEGLGRPLYRPVGVAVGPDGDIFVLDAGNRRVVVFDQSGAAVREFGHEGQGPGEFKNPVVIAVAADTVVVQDVENRRFSVFDTSGNFLRGQVAEDRPWVREMMILGERLLLFDGPRLPVAFFGPEPPTISVTIGLYSLAGEEIRELVKLSATLQCFFSSGDIGGIIPMACAYPQGAIAPDATVYASNGDEYQILAIERSGEPLWALRTNWSVEAPTEEHKGDVVAGFRIPDVREQDFTWPDRYAAIENLEVDSGGNLYVFPYTYRPDSEALDMYRPQGRVEILPVPVPLDVYSPAGERLFSGLVGIGSWHAAYGDHIYRIEIDPVSEEQVVARYRLTEKFE